MSSFTLSAASAGLASPPLSSPSSSPPSPLSRSRSHLPWLSAPSRPAHRSLLDRVLLLSIAH
ncbi:hypothetical protein PF005_g12677 [Phytophthora fragariae]|uniref:Uncharacterized protein n=1 Tax=Phytophthora fragariae TaxID=53985 RepID=A0A6A3XRV4_9STRA|nr:hypothetical protein PF003_g20099 [Phytophthora fragariae]KAE8936410.1 hypothetical protein PF009_g13671 [Phytophthora fragariae]KAE8991771.1 hypothetical protein PF011_g17808 [Phytophthora fragariae]KAE9108217.1 hypothetical protein PF010_g11985 [Phytophthora fragariae]KAE9111447.1 hypothetical protein PF007_g11478 [Phytophthora fragariae]